MYYRFVYTISGHNEVNSYDDAETANRVYINAEWKISHKIGKCTAAKLYAVSKDGEKLIASCKR